MCCNRTTTSPDYISAECNELLYDHFPLSSRSRLLNDLMHNHHHRAGPGMEGSERLVSYIKPSNDDATRYVLTTHRVLGVRAGRSPRLLWDVELEHILRVDEVCTGGSRGLARRRTAKNVAASPPPTTHRHEPLDHHDEQMEELPFTPTRPRSSAFTAFTTSDNGTLPALSLLLWYNVSGHGGEATSVALHLGPIPRSDPSPSWATEDTSELATPDHCAQHATLQQAVTFINQLCALCPQDIDVSGLETVMRCSGRVPAAASSSMAATGDASRGGLTGGVMRRLEEQEAMRIARMRQRRQDMGRHFCVACCHSNA
ncbi:Hypothetical protein, putative, partial [Bodo saltans]